ncbi:lipoyl(octanoyl) transferase LipB [soil metagenome]
MENTVEIFDIGYSPYHDSWNLQRRLQKQLIDQKLAFRNDPSNTKLISDSFLLVEHPHVYTLGKSGNAAHLLKSTAELKNIDAEFIENDRGGDITYHGPGQIVGYPILDLDRYFTDVHKYLRYLEEVIIKTCGDFGITAGQIEGLTGVWVGDQKICAMGIRCSRWVTMHGFAMNVNTDLSYFNNIVPCGISDKNVTSLSRLLNEKINIKSVKERIISNFAEQFGVNIKEMNSSSDLEQRLARSVA